MRLRVMTYNIHHGEGTDGALDLLRVADVIRAGAPDVACLQEVDQGVGRTHARDLPAELATLLGLHPTFGPNLVYDGGDYGNLTLSRWAPVEQRNLRLPLRPGEERRGCLICTFALDGRRIDIANTHLALDAEVRVREAGCILAALAPDRPTVLCGDLNEGPDGAAVRRLLARLADVASSEAPTYPATTSDGRRIDFILGDPGLSVVDYRVIDAPPVDVASDHRPVTAELEF